MSAHHSATQSAVRNLKHRHAVERWRRTEAFTLHHALCLMQYDDAINLMRVAEYRTRASQRARQSTDSTRSLTDVAVSRWAAGLPTGAHKVSKAGAQTLQRLQSVERVFCSQTLDTPGPLQGLYEGEQYCQQWDIQAGQTVRKAHCHLMAQSAENILIAGTAGCDGRRSSSECDFIISYSQNYKRLPSCALVRWNHHCQPKFPKLTHPLLVFQPLALTHHCHDCECSLTWPHAWIMHVREIGMKEND